MKVLWVLVGNLLLRLRILVRLEMDVEGMRGERFGLSAGRQLLDISRSNAMRRDKEMKWREGGRWK